MFGVTNIVAYTISVIAVILLPGPNSIFCLTVAAKQGVARGYRAAFGVLLGDTILMLVSALGAASVLRSSPTLFFILKCAGALYLSYLGLMMLISSYKQFKKPSTDEIVSILEKKSEIKNPFTKAMTLSLTNPKAILFFLSFFVMFVDPAYPYHAVPFLVLGLILQVTSLSYLSVLIFLGTRLTAWFGRQKKLGIFATAGVGMLFIGFSLKLITANL